MGRDGTTGWPRGLCSASPGVDPCDPPPPCVSPSCSSSPRQTPLRPSRPRLRSPTGRRGPNCSAAPVATTTSTKAEQASPTCCERRSTSSTATPRPQPKMCPDRGRPGTRGYVLWLALWPVVADDRALARGVELSDVDAHDVLWLRQWWLQSIEEDRLL